MGGWSGDVDVFGLKADCPNLDGKDSLILIWDMPVYQFDIDQIDAWPPPPLAACPL
jgi:hypothetical protein